MSKPVVFLDLDRTLYRTDEAATRIWMEIARLHPNIDASAEYDRGSDFHIYAPNGLYYYDFTAHLQNCGLDAAAVYAELRASSLADNQLLFPGAEQLVGWLRTHSQLALLTYGSEDYQQLKTTLCPALHDILVHITREPKSQWLKDKGTCWLVDDKAIGNELPAGVRFIQVSLEGRSFVSQSVWPQFTSLEDLQRYLVNALGG